MARALKDKANVIAPDGGDFPFGRAKDKGATPGSLLNEEMFGDILQFFEALMDRAGVVHNGVADSDYSGFQLFEAFVKYFIPDGMRKTFHRIPIGPWNMQSNSQVTVPHGIASSRKVYPLYAQIIHDTYDPVSAPSLFNLFSINTVGNPSGSISSVNNTNIILNRVTGGFFDSASYSNAVINRGYVTFMVEHDA